MMIPAIRHSKACSSALSILTQSSTALLLLVSPAHAQFGLDKLFSEVKSLGFGGACWQIDDAPLVRGADCDLASSIWLELGYDIARFPLPGSEPFKTDTAWVTTERQLASDGSETSRKVTPKVTPRLKNRAYIDLQFAVGYSQFSELEATTEGVGLTGQIREIPSATVYGVLRLPSLAWSTGSVDLIGDARTGIVQVHDFAARIDDGMGGSTNWKATGQSFLFGLGAGLRARFWASEIFGHVSYSWRELPSLVWSGSGAVPNSLPSRIDASGRVVRLGVRYRIR